jgi:hypothetical protein
VVRGNTYIAPLRNIGSGTAESDSDLVSDLAVAGESFVIVVTGEKRAVVAGDEAVRWRAPYPFRLKSIWAAVNAAPTSGNVLLRIRVGSRAILSSDLMIQTGHATSLTAATRPSIIFPDVPFAGDIAIDVVSAGGAKGLKVYFVGDQV